ncbi:MAG: hypothetical protein ACOX74_05960 [Lachnospiraceae bacterium]|jgi:F-type H+-transporting ATPase subunit b
MSVSDVIFMCINFVILMWIAWKLVGKKGFKSFKDRREHIAQEIQEADKARSDAANLDNDIAAAKADSAARQEQIMKNARMYAENASKEAAENAEVEKKAIIANAGSVRKQALAATYSEICEDTLSKVADNTRKLLSDNKYAEERKTLDTRYIDQIGSVIRPTSDDIRNLSSVRGIDMNVISTNGLSESEMGKLRNTITDDFIDYSFATDSSMKHDLCVKIGGKSYVGSFNDVLDLIASDNGLSEGRIGILKRAVADVYIDYDFATDENLKNGMQVKIGDETFTGSFNDIIAQISSDAAV